MIITKETDYALRILRRLSTGKRFTAKQLSETEVIPKQFAHKILKKLEKSGFLQILRGSEGGCSLICDLHEKSLFDLVIAMETNSRLSACMDPQHKCEWRSANNSICKVHIQMNKIQQAIDDQFRSRSLYWILFGEE